MAASARPIARAILTINFLFNPRRCRIHHPAGAISWQTGNFLLIRSFRRRQGDAATAPANGRFVENL